MTAPPAAPPADSSRPSGLLVNPLADWPNDDLLFDETQRAFIRRHHPRAAPIFDWPELRALFLAHDPPAGKFRKRSRRTGMLAVALGCLSLILTAVVGSLGADALGPKRVFGALAALFAVASGVAGFVGLLRGGAKSRWLSHRFWTERMRQLHFQLIINNLPLAAEAMADADAMAAWQLLRARALDAFVHRLMTSVETSLGRMLRDLAEDQPWLDPAWVEWPEPAADASPELAELFELLKYQRFGIQRRYSELKLQPGLHSPRSRSFALRLSADIMTALVLAASAAAGFLFLFAPAWPGLGPVLCLGGTLAALILGLRVLDEGLQLRSETERYTWYLAAVESLERRYDAAAPRGKIAVLREMERLSYQELRWFTVSFDEARFVM